jgi:hypothetical protein
MKTLLLLTIFLLTIPSYSIDQYKAESLGSTPPKLKVIIDASKDGGAWWFPQAREGFDPQKEHQGKRLADYLRSSGWEVTEIPRGESPVGKLNDDSIVVRMNFSEHYDREEAVAYKKFVKNGGRLLLTNGYVREGEEDQDLVARAFGIRFKGTVEAREIKRWGVHRLTNGLKPLPFHVGSIVTRSPKATVPLAYLDNKRLVMGIVPYGKGRIIFLSFFYTLLEVHQPFTERIFNELAKR